MSTVFYKFKSAKDFDTCTFDGNEISAFDLKRDIMVSKKLGKGTDFDLSLYHVEDNTLEYTDTDLISRNSSVIVSRKPAIKPGKGNAQKYLNASVPVAAPKWIGQRAPAAKPAQEQDSIDKMLSQSKDSWERSQDQQELINNINNLAQGKQPIKPRGYTQQWQAEQKPPPPGYICYRCGKQGHHIQFCPTIGDPNFDNKPKLKKTTGIPKMFLKTVENADENNTQGLMVTQDGSFVIARPNE
jgi:protein MPE1